MYVLHTALEDKASCKILNRMKKIDGTQIHFQFFFVLLFSLKNLKFFNNAVVKGLVESISIIPTILTYNLDVNTICYRHSSSLH